MVARQTLTLFVRVQILLPQPKYTLPPTGGRVYFLLRRKKDLNGRVLNARPMDGQTAPWPSAVVAREQILLLILPPIGGRAFCLLRRKQGLNGRVRGRPVRRTGLPRTRPARVPLWCANKSDPSPIGRQISVFLCARINRQTCAVLGPAKRRRDAHTLPPDEAAARRRRRPRTAPQAHTGRITAL